MFFCVVGFPVEDTVSHIIPIKIGDPLKTTQISDLLLHQFGHYIQAINYPTVARGEEKLRLAATPRHSFEMINNLVADMKKAWKILNLPIVPLDCSKNCVFCNSDAFQKQFNCSEEFAMDCAVPNCPRAAIAVGA